MHTSLLNGTKTRLSLLGPTTVFYSITDFTKKMGKRKSKASKQKQTKAKASTQKRKQNARFNIPISKDGMIEQTKPNKKDTKAIKKFQKKLRGSTPNASKIPAKKNDEHKDFEDEYRSLQERQYQAQLSKKDKSKKNTIEMAPASLQLNQKPTAEQLVDDAAKHLGSLNQLGQASMLSSQAVGSNPNSNLLQVLAAQKRHESHIAQREAAKPRDIGEGNNFWALQDEDEEDKTKEVSPTFNFAAPSFAMPSTFGTGAGQIPDDDPDL